MMYASDDEIIAIMAGPDENATRLRNSPPYVGLLDEQVRMKLVEESGSALDRFAMARV